MVTKECGYIHCEKKTLIERRVTDSRPRHFHDRSCAAKQAKMEGRIGRGSSVKLGDTQVNKGGYVLMFVGHDDPMADKRGYCLQHRWVMAQILGRPLFQNENVHHKNGNRQDNRPQHLELWVKSQPCGQRAIDLLAWAREIIATYEPVESRLVDGTA